MVQAAENWADLEGVVQDVTPDPSRPGWVMASVDVRSASPVEGYPNMLAKSVGSLIRLAILAREANGTVAPGVRIRARARLAAPRLAFARPGALDTTPPPD
jgi:hypothetical protein